MLISTFLVVKIFHTVAGFLQPSGKPVAVVANLADAAV